MKSINYRCQFHQHFTGDFCIQKCFAQLFSYDSLALKFFRERIFAKKLLVKCWWNKLKSERKVRTWCLLVGILCGKAKNVHTVRHFSAVCIETHSFCSKSYTLHSMEFSKYYTGSWNHHYFNVVPIFICIKTMWFLKCKGPNPLPI